MKMILLAACTAIMSMQVFAGDPGTPSTCATEYPEQISMLMQTHSSSFGSQDLSGKVKITFTVTPDNTLKVIDVDSKNVYLENHVLQSLSGQKMDAACSEEGKVYSITVNFIYVI